MILFVTRNIDTFNNPTLFGLISILEEQKKESVLICNNNYFKPFFSYNRVLIYPNAFPNFRRNIFKYAYSIYKHYKQKRELTKLTNKVKTLIGIDPDGIIWANELREKHFTKASLDYFSFEIFTAKHYNKKQLEITACKNLRNIIIQDNLRDSFIRKENEISSHIKSHFIPVALPQLAKKTSSSVVNIRKKFNIDSSKKLIVNFGSFSTWSGGEIIYDLIANNKLPQDFVVVIHSRFQLNPEFELHKKILDVATQKTNLFITTDYIESFDDAVAYVKQFDLGLAFYVPDFNDRYIGENIYHIGFASGKFSQYMKAGLPTVASNLPTYIELNKEFKFGFTIENTDELSNVLTTAIDYKTLHKNALHLFESKLDPTQNLLTYINENLN